MKTLFLLLWILLLPFYWWIWQNNHSNCCDGNVLKVPTQEVAPVRDATPARIIDSEDEEAMAREANAAVEEAESKNEVTLVETIDKGFFYFPSNSSRAQYSGRTEEYLKRVMESAIASGKKIVVTGHADNTGNETFNMELGQARADEIKRKLISLGIPESRIEAISRGDKEPIASNATPQGRQQNRRVELVIVQ